MATFKELMQKAQTIEDIKVSPLPAGDYECVIKSINPEAKLRSDFGDVPEGTEHVEIFLKPVRELDVDPDLLDQCPDWSEKLLSIRLISSGDMVKLADVANGRGLVYDVGLDMSDYLTGEADFDQLWKDLLGRHVGVQVIHREAKKSGALMANVKRTFPLE